MAALFSWRVAILDSMAKVNLCLVKGQRREVFKAVMVDGGDPWALSTTTTRSFIGLTSVRTGKLFGLKTAGCSRSRFVRRSKRYGGGNPLHFSVYNILGFSAPQRPLRGGFGAKGWLFPDYFINRHAHFFGISLLNSGHHKDSLTIGSLCPLFAKSRCYRSDNIQLLNRVN